MRRLMAATVAAATALGLAGCGVDLPPGTDGDLTNGWPAIALAAPFMPAEGTCHEELEDQVSTETYRPVPCTALHRTETVAVGLFTEKAITGRSEVPEYGSRAEAVAYRDCDRRTTTFVGGPWRSGLIAVTVALPTQAGWSGGARWYRCDITQTNLGTYGSVPRRGTMARALQRPGPLRLGCFNPTEKGAHITKMTPVACTRKHTAEFAGLWTAPTNLTYKKAEDSEAGCRKAIADYTGVPNDSNLRYRTGWISYSPSIEQWNRGVRDVQCFLWFSGRPLTRSMKGAGTSGLPIQYG